MKKLLSFFLVIVFIVGFASPLHADVKAIYNLATLIIDGEKISVQAYNVAGNNYFKLRDVAMFLNGSEKQFSVAWNGKTRSISLITGESYSAVGGELSEGDGVNKRGLLSTASITKDGSRISPKGYNVSGNNYYKLRDLGDYFNFFVGWDGVKREIIISTSDSATSEDPENEDAKMVDKLAREILDDIDSPSSSSRSRVRIVYDWSREKLRYSSFSDYKNWEEAAIRGLKYRTGDCYVLCSTCKALLDKMGFETKMVTRSKNAKNIKHHWLLVKVDGSWYHMDPTKVQKSKSVFLLTDDELDAVVVPGRPEFYKFDKNLYPRTP